MRIVAAAVAAVALAALLPAAARAHPELVDTMPASKATLAKAPARVVVRLSEPAHPVGDGPLRHRP